MIFGHCGWLRLVIGALIVVLSTIAKAQLTIEITRGVEGALPIAVVAFAANEAFPAEQDIAAIVSADLRRSGRFAPVDTSGQSWPGTHSGTQLNADLFARWRAQGVDHLVVGRLTPSGEQVTVQFQLADVFQGVEILGLSFTVPRANLRRLAHHIADRIYQQLTGERGAFDTRIAYITVLGQGRQARYSLMIADADGFAPQAVLRSPEPLLSPAWSPDGRQLAYVSFENRRAQIVVQDLFSGQRQVVSAQEGINSAPAWSPDGQRLAVTLSRDGNPEIYILDLPTKQLRRVTQNSAIDTEPTWSPDGLQLIFTSDRSGGPQLYRVPVAGGRAQRLTFDGRYNARATFSPDGKNLAFVHRKRGQFSIALMDSAGGPLRAITSGGLDESPSFSPNGRMIIYATSSGGRGVLAAVSVDGRVTQRLRLQGGQVREPSWSTYTQ